MAPKVRQRAPKAVASSREPQRRAIPNQVLSTIEEEASDDIEVAAVVQEHPEVDASLLDEAGQVEPVSGSQSPTAEVSDPVGAEPDPQPVGSHAASAQSSSTLNARPKRKKQRLVTEMFHRLTSALTIIDDLTKVSRETQATLNQLQQHINEQKATSRVTARSAIAGSSPTMANDTDSKDEVEEEIEIQRDDERERQRVEKNKALHARYPLVATSLSDDEVGSDERELQAASRSKKRPRSPDRYRIKQPYLPTPRNAIEARRQQTLMRRRSQAYFGHEDTPLPGRTPAHLDTVGRERHRLRRRAIETPDPSLTAQQKLTEALSEMQRLRALNDKESHRDESAEEDGRDGRATQAAAARDAVPDGSSGEEQSVIRRLAFAGDEEMETTIASGRAPKMSISESTKLSTARDNLAKRVKEAIGKWWPRAPRAADGKTHFTTLQYLMKFEVVVYEVEDEEHVHAVAPPSYWPLLVGRLIHDNTEQSTRERVRMLAQGRTWEEFKTLAVAEFDNASATDQLVSNWSSITLRSGEAIADFNLRFNEAMVQLRLDSMSWEHTPRYLTLLPKRLTDEMNRQWDYSHTNTERTADDTISLQPLRNVQSLADQVDRRLTKEHGNWRQTPHNGKRSSGDRGDVDRKARPHGKHYCEKHGMGSHRTDECRQRNQNTTGGRGLPPPKPSASTTNSNTGSTRSGQGITCYTCHQPGHRSTECPTRSSVQPTARPTPAKQHVRANTSRAKRHKGESVETPRMD